MKSKPAYLNLQSGKHFEGFSPSHFPNEEPVYGEVVFTTGMTGYYESLTDPSYRGQILCFTYPLIGNYGIAKPSQWESGQIHAKGVIVSEACDTWSHASGLQSLAQWLEKEKVALLTGADTRALTQYIRERGSTLGAITLHPSESLHFWDPNQTSLVAEVSPKEPSILQEGDKTVILVDCGMKENILRNLMRYPVTIKRVPWNYDYSEEPFDGVFLSNGPGDPEKCTVAVQVLKKAMQREKPIFGICLGTQLLAKAAGASTYKLPFGHRSHNQPCINVETGACYITSQNHGYAIDADSLPSEWCVHYKNLNDNSVEGIKHKTLPFSAVQFHPEAAPGPTDTEWLFQEFIQKL